MNALNWILGLVAVQRLIELAHARSNTVRLRRLGAVEADAGAYPLFVLLHAGWLSPAGLRMRPGRGAGPGRRRRLVGAPPPAHPILQPAPSLHGSGALLRRGDRFQKPLQMRK